ncbi:diguanylate cyclase [Syntrophotalea carbinolica DSM 2380]|uniref:diguanylate cyclase n=1 Tax=Syntrophotalea carbinolica (strain DSM 2380 / NBRC 103641 / GraBd1) TaxID=338963 RepID=Q3A271_SYNC1|nr:GGDEF domain-containing protein [Syntrophotalea carbinolica]ABA89536.1 diguanylate cyclase [Syntrophotalea carbinolica DSM 2380]
MKQSKRGKTIKAGRIGKRLLIAIILFSSVITLFTSAIQLYIDFNDDLEHIHIQFDQIEKLHLKPLAENVWSFYDEMIMVQLQAWVELPAIEYLEVSVENHRGWKAGTIPHGKTIEKSFKLIHSSPHRQIDVGTLRVIASLDETYHSLIRKWGVILSTNIIKIFLVASFIFFLFHFQVTRHLLHIASFTNDLDVNKSFIPLKLSRKDHPNREDELDKIVRAINNRTQTLKSNQDYLEDRIAERTKELETQKKIAENLARLDPLTGLSNRRAFFEYGLLLENQIARHHHHFSIIMLDIDHFKKINDCYGHEMGDEALKTLAEHLNAIVRSSDILGRLGGEEFAIIMPHASSEEAAIMSERLKTAISKIVLSDNEQRIRFTVSFGIAECNEKITSFQQVLNNADKALYQAKNEGRNTFRIYQGEC